VTHTDDRDPVQVRRAYKFRAYPTRPQEGRSAGMLADHCDLYNAALEESITCHRCGARCIRPQQDTVICPACGPHDADTNGAINIAARAGLGSGQVTQAA
jgi:rubrerythrin